MNTPFRILPYLLLSLLITTPAKAAAWAGSSEPKEQARNFYDVLEDLLGDFEYDLRNGDVQGLKDLSIRNIAVSENIPVSFKQHLDLVVTERILKTSKTKVIQCLACRAKKTSISGEQVIITSPETNQTELSRLAKTAGIENFMDLSFNYQPSGMILSLTTVDPETGAIIWSRTYNSETSRAAAVRRGVDFSQVDDSRRAAEYKPNLQHRIAIYINQAPNLTTGSTNLGLGYRLMERYDNRKKEVGFELDYFYKVSAITNSTGTENIAGANIWRSVNVTLLFTHAWNLIDVEENFNRARGSIFVGAGGTYASGFLGGLVRGGFEWRLAKFWAVSVYAGYRPAAVAFLAGTEAGSIEGLDYGAGINFLF